MLYLILMRSIAEKSDRLLSDCWLKQKRQRYAYGIYCLSADRHHKCHVQDVYKRQPRDKGPVEGLVQKTYNAASALLHDEVFYNLPSMNARIYELMDGFNEKPSRTTGRSRRDIFEAEEHQMCIRDRYHTILRDVIMIADTLETAGKMAGLQLLECEILSHSRGCVLDTSVQRSARWYDPPDERTLCIGSPEPFRR